MQIRHFLARRRLQPMYTALHEVLLAGLGVGVHGGFEYTGEQWVVRQLAADQSPSLTILDVGANVGEYSALILDTLGPRATVHAFEPSADAYSVLSSRLLGRPGVHLHPFGLGFEEAEVPLYTSQPASTWASVLPRRAEYTGVTFMPAGTVRLRRLDVVCRELNLCRIDLLKVDVEGYDLAVLQGAGELLESGAIRRVQFEFGEANIDSRTYLRDFWELLNPHYRLYRIVSNGLAPIERYNGNHELFRLSNYLAVLRSVRTR